MPLHVNCLYFITEYSYPSVSTGDQFQDLCAKSMDAQVPYIKWCGALQLALHDFGGCIHRYWEPAILPFNPFYLLEDIVVIHFTYPHAAVIKYIITSMHLNK